MQISRAKAICEEFCEEVRVSEDAFGVEVKCILNIEYFTGLAERLSELGYLCSQVQGDVRRKKCAAWFSPATHENESFFNPM